jgi:hypothetical protein
MTIVNVTNMWNNCFHYEIYDFKILIQRYFKYEEIGVIVSRKDYTISEIKVKKSDTDKCKSHYFSLKEFNKFYGKELELKLIEASETGNRA